MMGLNKLLTVLWVVGLCGLLAVTAGAGKPEKVFAGKVLVASKRFPTHASSPGEYVAKLKKHAKAILDEDKEAKGWKVHYVAFFKSPLNSIEVIVKVFDISEREHRLVSTFPQYLDQRGLLSLVADVWIDREKLGVNRKVRIVLEHKGRALASGVFTAKGEREKFSGKVDFTDEAPAQTTPPSK